jgi:hypothetical protein
MLSAYCKHQSSQLLLRVQTCMLAVTSLSGAVAHCKHRLQQLTEHYFVQLMALSAVKHSLSNSCDTRLCIVQV